MAVATESVTVIFESNLTVKALGHGFGNGSAANAHAHATKAMMSFRNIAILFFCRLEKIGNFWEEIKEIDFGFLLV